MLRAKRTTCRVGAGSKHSASAKAPTPAFARDSFAICAARPILSARVLARRGYASAGERFRQRIAPPLQRYSASSPVSRSRMPFGTGKPYPDQSSLQLSKPA